MTTYKCKSQNHTVFSFRTTSVRAARRQYRSTLGLPKNEPVAVWTEE